MGKKKKRDNKTSPITTVSTGGKVGEVPTSVTVSTYPGPKYLCGNGWLADELWKVSASKPAFRSVEEEAFEKQPVTDLVAARDLIERLLDEDDGRDRPYVGGVERGTDGRLRVTIRFDGEKYPGTHSAEKERAHTRKYILTVEEEKPRFALGGWISSTNH